MNFIDNFCLSARQHSPSWLEDKADRLLLPARVLFGGRKVLAYGPYQAYTKKERCSLISKIIAFVALPFALLGICLKLFCLRDKELRRFCVGNINDAKHAHPKLFEIWEHVYFTGKFVKESPANGGICHFEPLDLYECSCPVNGAFHRSNSPRRENLENATVAALLDNFKDQPLKLLSMGAGGLLSDFLVIEKLITVGFKQFEIDCVDPFIDLEERIERIRNFFKDCPEVTVQMNGYTNIKDVPKKDPYCAILAIDYTPLTAWDRETQFASLGDLMESRRRLHNKGFLALGFAEDDTLTGPNFETQVITRKGSPSINLTSHLAKLPRYPIDGGATQLSIAIPSITFADFGHIFCYALALSLEKAPVSRLWVWCLEEKEKKLTFAFYNLLRSLFPRTVIELNPHKIPEQKFKVFLTGHQEDHFIDKSYLSLLKDDADAYLVFPKGIILHQQGLNEANRTVVYSREGFEER